jgi:hypothetical protein
MARLVKNYKNLKISNKTLRNRKLSKRLKRQKKQERKVIKLKINIVCFCKSHKLNQTK